MRLSLDELGFSSAPVIHAPGALDRFRLLLRSGPHVVLARAWLDSNGKAFCDDVDIQRGWELQGVESSTGPRKVFPNDGATFLETVFLAYQQFPYLWVEVEPGQLFHG